MHILIIGAAGMVGRKLTEKLVKGKLHEEWAQRRTHNHFLDCRVYAMAMAEHLGISRMTKAQWAELRASREPEIAPDLFAPQTSAIIANTEQAADTLPLKPVPDKQTKARENRWKKRR